MRGGIDVLAVFIRQKRAHTGEYNDKQFGALRECAARVSFELDVFSIYSWMRLSSCRVPARGSKRSIQMLLIAMKFVCSLHRMNAFIISLLTDLDSVEQHGLDTFFLD